MVDVHEIRNALVAADAGGAAKLSKFLMNQGGSVHMRQEASG